jgi:adenylate cyclase
VKQDPAIGDTGEPIHEARLPGRIEIAFAAEERNGLKLAFKLRLVALCLVALFLTGVNPFPQALYYYALFLGFVVIGAISLVPRRDHLGPPAWTRWLVPLLDLALVTFAVVYPNPLGNSDVSELPLVLRSDALVYPIILIALSALTNSPHQVHWTGACAAIMWTIASFWVASLPRIHWGTMGNDPNLVMAHSLLQQIFLLLIVSGLLAAAVRRSRSLTLRQVKSERERTQLARYFSTNLVDQLADADRPFSEVREQTVAILFADIVGFTSLGQRMSPVDLIGLLREFHERMQAAVFANGGTLDKYLGDGLMATFGTPKTGPRDAANALAAARAMTTALAVWNLKREEQNQPIIRIGIGVHWGPVVLGDIGGHHRLEFATIGDTVNIASRLEHATRDLNADIVASIDLVDAVRACVGSEEVQGLLQGFAAATPHPVRGRSAPLQVFARVREVATSSA